MVMKAPPAAALIVVAPQLVLEFLEIALDAPANLDEPHEFVERDVGRDRGEPILGGRLVAPRPLDQQPLGGPRLRPLIVAMGRAHAHRRKARLHRAPRPGPPPHGAPHRRGQPSRQHLHRQWVHARRPSQPRRRTPLPAPRRGRQRALAGRPHRRFARDADGVREAARAEPLAKRGDHPVAGVGDDGGAGQPFGQQLVDRLQGDGPLRLKPHRHRDVGGRPAPPVPRPRLGQIEPIGTGHAEHRIDQRDGDRDLTIVLLAARATVLARHPDGMQALLRDAGVIDDPRPHRGMALELRKQVVAGRAQHGALIPGRHGDKVMHRLVPRPHPPGVDLRRHRFNALALARE